MEGFIVRAVRLLALFIAFCFLLVTADCVAGLMFNRYAPGGYENLKDLVSTGSAPARAPGADIREHERKLALDRPTRRLIQQGLTNDGFDPGTPDGQFGPRTRAAIRAWQAARGAATTGYLDEVQAELLRKAAARQPAAPAGFEGSEFFTRGSHQDEVLRLQGTPDSLTALLDSEIWRYGFSSVTISTQSREVTEWSNRDGNLRVRLLPRTPPAGLEGSEFFTRGSHQDEVLRLQGTPDSLTVLLDSEIWRYRFSSVTISTRSREVTEWSNRDGNLRVRLLPGTPSSRPPRATEPAPGAVFRLGTDVVGPRVLRTVQAEYTDEALDAKITGTVQLEIVVLPDGTVGDVHITRSLDPGLDEEAVKAVKQWVFEPGTRLGEPVAVQAEIEFFFRLL